MRHKVTPPEQARDVPQFPLPTPEQVLLVRTELHAMLDGARFNESFWQSMLNPSRAIMEQDRRDRHKSITDAVHQARVLMETASTVEQKRAARRAQERVEKMQGALRHRNSLMAPDPVNLAWQHSVQWIMDARDAAVHISRTSAALDRMLGPQTHA